MSLHRNGWVGPGPNRRVSVQEYDRLVTDQFISGLNDAWMISEILKEVTTLKDIVDATSEHVLLWCAR